MRCFTIIRALFVRVMFAGHGVIAIWRLFMVIQELWCWYLSAALLGLLIETIVTLAVKRGKEWKWFCPSVFFYLASVVPAIWFLELNAMETRIKQRESLNTTFTKVNNTEENLKMQIDSLGLEITFPLSLTSALWLRVLEQFLLLMLIVGRWLLPKGALSHNQLSQLLLVYVGTAADIVEFYEAFNEEQVMYNRLLIFILLGIWTLSLLQFTLVLTATKARRDHIGIPQNPLRLIGSDDDGSDDSSCCNPEIYGIIISILMQDCPFLVIRLMLIVHYKVVSYTNMFFTSKNTLVIILLLYRVVVVQSEGKKKKKIKQKVRKNGNPQLGFIPVNNAFADIPNQGRISLKASRSTPNINKIKTGGNPHFRSYESLPRYKTMVVSDRRSDPMEANKVVPRYKSSSSNLLGHDKKSNSLAKFA